MLYSFRIAALGFALAVAVAVGFAQDDSGPSGNYSGSLVFESDRNVAEALAQAQRELAAGETTAGLSRLQSLLDFSADVLIERGGTYVSVVEAANRIIGSLSPAQRQSYRRLVKDASQSEFDLARSPMNGDRLARLTDRYRHTPVGADAAELLATLAFDRGDRREAASWCYFIADWGDGTAVPAHIVRLKQRIDAAHLNDVDGTEDAATVSHAGDDAAQLWTLDLGVAPNASRAIDAALAEFDAQEMTPMLTARPLIVGGRIVTRTLQGLICVDATSGELLWKHDISSHAARLAQGPGELNNPVRNGQISATLLRKLIRDSLQDELSSDGRVVYNVVTGERPVDAKPTEPSNVLMAVDLATGEAKWEVGPQQVPKKRFAKQPVPRYFLGPPLVDGAQRFVLAQRKQTVELVALDAEDGQTLWSVPLGEAVRDLWVPNNAGEDTPTEERERQSTACRLTRSGSRVLCATGAGSLVCVDTLKRRVQWAYRYPRNDLPRHAPELGDATHFREMPVRDSLLVADCWVEDGTAVCVAPDAERLFACALDTGELLWSRPRADGFHATPGDAGDLILLGESGIRALRMTDGSEQWFTPTSRPAGSGFVDENRYLLPLDAGGHLAVRLADGGMIESHAEEPRAAAFTIDSHPGTGLRSVHLRNLQGLGELVVSQSPTTLERVSLTASVRDESSPQGESTASLLTMLRDARSTLVPAIAVVRRADSRVLLGDSLLLGLLEGSGVQQSVADQATALMVQLERASAQGDGVQTAALRRRIQALHPEALYLTTEDGLHSCRLDRWIEGMSQDVRATERSRSETSIGTKSSNEWPEIMPTVTEQKTSFGESHFLLVPMQVEEDSTWRDVTVEVDRQGRMIQFRDAAHFVPMAVALPAEVGTTRLEVGFLQAWGVGEVLLVRVGLELVAFRKAQGGELPDAPLWPPRGKTLSLAGPNPPLATAMRPVPEEANPAWNPASSGWEDVFGRRLGEVGPVCADYFCYQERGHLIALETRTGNELWRHSRLPVGTWSIGDDRHVVLFQATSPVVTVLDALDGRTTGTWELNESLVGKPVSGPSPFEPRAVSGTLAALVLPSGAGLELRAIDMATGQPIWQRDVVAGAQTFLVSQSCLGVVEPVGSAGEVAVTFVDWRTGDVVSRHEPAGPAGFESVTSFCDAEQVYLIVSGKITDLQLLNSRQIHGGAHRQDVNGWLHAFNSDGTTHVWSQPVENVSFPIVQPRHVPLMLVNDTIQSTDANLPQGRLMCIDKRTGKTVASLVDSMHIYPTLEADAQARRINIRMRGRSLMLDYGSEAPAP